ncbi:MAG: protein kinase, partial [Planctomycetota bacterium]
MLILNIIIGEFGAILVMDWGIAIDIQDDPPRDLPVPKKKSVRRPMGTPNYLAPELALGKGFSIGPWTDVYLLGAILYELITNKPPHKAPNIQESLAIAIENKISPLPEDVPEELAEICLQALSKNPKKRHPSVLAFQQSLQDFLEHRESLHITTESKKILQHTKKHLSPSPTETPPDRNRLYEDFNQAISGFRQALVLWTGNNLARKLEQEAHLDYAKVSLQNDDLGLAEAQALELDSQIPEIQLILEKIKNAKQQKARSQKVMKRLRLGLGAAVVLILFGLIGFILWIQNEQRQTALQYASLYTKSLSEFRGLYSSKIVSRVKNHGIIVSHDYKKDNEVPFPATFSIELSQKISEGKDG